MIGPLVPAESCTLAPKFPFYVKTFVVGEEDSTRYALVDAAAGTTLFTDSNEGLVRRFGEQLGGRRIEAPATG